MMMSAMRVVEYAGLSMTRNMHQASGMDVEKALPATPW